MVSIDTLKGDIDNKEVDIIKTKQDLAKAQKARDKQYESMKLRIQALYEQGGDVAWFQMMLNSEDLSELLTRSWLDLRNARILRKSNGRLPMRTGETEKNGICMRML